VQQPPPVTAEYMRNWGKHTHGSPLYARLVEVVAGDSDLLRVINRIENRPPPNLLFAAVQYLLMNGAGSDLAAYYPSLVEVSLPPEGVSPVFREFVLANEEEIVALANTRYTQTNESRRCVALLPLVVMAPFDRFHLVDIGPSAGFNLGLDRYRYRFDDLEWGPESPLVLDAESRGVDPPLHDIEVLSRTGLDLNPLDPGDEEARRWLDALIWPEHEERRSRLRRALAIISEIPVEMVPGDALVTLPRVLESLPSDEPVVVINSFAFAQFSPEGRQEVEQISERARKRRPVFRVIMELFDASEDWARMVIDDGTGPKTVGQAHPHGEWIELF
jgi:hypothetical protein